MRASRRDESEVRLVCRTARIPAPPFRALLGDVEAPRTVWDAPDEATVVAGGAAASLTAAGPDRFGAIRDRAGELLAAADVGADGEPSRPRLFGGFGFHDDPTSRTGERAGGEGGDSPWAGYPDARFILPRVQVTYADGNVEGNGSSEAGGRAWLTVTAAGPDASPEAVEELLARTRDRVADLPDPGPVAGPPGIRSRERPTAREDWRAGVESAVERIRAGDLRKVVLAQSLRAALDRPVSLPDLLTRLGAKYPDCYRFLVEPAAEADPPGGSFFGATPERLVSLRGRTVETGALAGTTGRGETPAEDEWLARELLSDGKNRHEHELVAEAIRDQLASVCSSVSTGELSVRRLATVQHLRTPIAARLADESHVLSLVEALHPTPAVGGLPPAAALATIRETEPFDRGWYAAPVGWFDAAGNGTFAVAIRSAVADGATASLFAGVGIVADSDPDREWEEVQLKYRPILDELERG